MSDLNPVFIDPAGVEWPLDVDLPVMGRWAPPFTFLEQEGFDGTTLDDVRVGPREIPFPMWLDPGNDDPQAYHELVRAFIAAANPLRGDGALRWPAPDGSTRDIVCRYIRGLEITEDIDNGGSVYTFTRQVVVFRAVDPYWRDTDPLTLDVQRGAGLATFFPFPPLELVAGDVFATPTVDNGGDVEAWPVWTVSGPADSVAIVNTTTGRRLQVNVPLAAGETLTIDTRPGAKTVVDGTGANRFGSLSADSTLWPFTPGLNNLDVELANAGDDAHVGLEWRRRWMTV